MFTFLKANIASLTASVADYLITLGLAKIAGMENVPATVIGACCGGVINFLMGRGWVFKSAGTGRKFGRQAGRYLMVWTGSLLLNAGGIYLLVDLAGVPLAIGKIVISLFVALLYNYPLQKRYVFYNN